MRQRRLRLLAIEALERLVKQFRSREELWPFRVPHEPLLLEDEIARALSDEEGHLDPAELRSRAILTLEWAGGESRWSAWAIALPSGTSLYCDSDDGETRVLASARRGSPAEADRFFLELLAASQGHDFGIEMHGGAPDRVRTAIADRGFLSDIFVELFEGTTAEHTIHAAAHVHPQRGGAGGIGRDFRSEVDRWLGEVLVTPAPSKRPGRTPRRLADERAKRG